MAVQWRLLPTPFLREVGGCDSLVIAALRRGNLDAFIKHVSVHLSEIPAASAGMTEKRRLFVSRYVEIVASISVLKCPRHSRIR